MKHIASKRLLTYLKSTVVERCNQNLFSTLLIFSASGINAELKHVARDSDTYSKHLIAFLDIQTLHESQNIALLETLNLLKQTYKTLDIETSGEINLQKFFDIIQKLSNEEYSVCFVLSNFYLALNGNKQLQELLKSIRKIDQNKISFVFITESEYDDNDVTKLDWLGGPFSQHIIKGVDMLFDKESAEIQIENQEKLSGVKLSTDFTKKLIEITFGDPYTLRMILMKAISDVSFQTNFVKTTDIELYSLIGKDNLDLRFKRIVTKLKKASLECLANEYKNPVGFLVDAGLIYNGKPLNTLFDLYVTHNKDFLHKLIETPNYIANTTSIKETLTGQEVIILNFLENKVGTAITRDEVAQIIWGSNWEESYSDWAIDQAMSRLRAKFKKTGYNKTLKAIKGKGFIFQ